MGKPLKNKRKPKRREKWVTVARADAIADGRGAAVDLKKGAQVAIFNARGTFYAIENFCPHKGRPLADSPLVDGGAAVKCEFHGWRFDLETGECLKKKSCSIESYPVAVEDGWIKIFV